MLPSYSFKDLNESDRALRRAKLDAAGRLTVLSQIVALLLITSYHLARRRGWGNNRVVRKAEWVLTVPLSVRWREARCAGDWLSVVGWVFWCCWIVVRDSGDDYLHLTRAFGMVAVANLPLHFLLAMKSAPLRFAVGATHEGTVNWLHQWLGRTVYALLMTHAGLYVNYFWRMGKMTTRFMEFDVLCGVFGTFVLTTIVLTSSPLMRHYSYRLFSLLHAPLATLLSPTLYLHTPHLRPYILASSLLYIFDKLIRQCTSQSTTAVLSRLSPDLLQLSLPLDPGTVTVPGTHILLTIPSISSYASNPFTIASGPNSNGSVSIIVRVRGGITKSLGALQEGRLPVLVDGPYGAPSAFPKGWVERFDTVLLIAGGVGGSFCVPWVRYLVRRGRGQVRFVWAVKSIADLSWAFEDSFSISSCTEVYFTGSSEYSPVTSSSSSSSTNPGMELQDRGEKTRVDECAKLGINGRNVKSGRPDVVEIIAETGRKVGRTAVMVCGPRAMGVAVKRAMGKVVEREVWMHVEEFGY